MPSVGKLATNVIALYDNVSTPDAPLTTSTTPYLVQYGNTQFRTAQPLTSCTVLPDSIDFSPRTIRAGVDEVLTLKAYETVGGVTRQIPWFGSKTTTSNIQFRNANKPYKAGFANYVDEIDRKDIVKWDSMEIKVKIPSLYTENAVSSTGCAGSGYIKIIKNANELYNTADQGEKLHIEYAALNYEVGTGAAMTKKRALMVNQGCKNQYTLRCHTSINTLAMQRCTWKAAQHWNQKLGYEVFKIDSSALVTYTTHATECIVYKFAYPDSVNAVMATNAKNTTTGESTTTGNAYFYNTGFNIKVSAKFIDSSKFQMDYPNLEAAGVFTYTQTSNKLSYYEAMLHELGHSLGLNHDIDENHNEATQADAEIMYAEAKKDITPANRITLNTGNGNSLNGVQRILNDSKNTTWTSAPIALLRKPTLQN
jgi:hypothetical protein